VAVGVDEVGRGSWAGPLVVGAVILSSPIEGLKDSKLLTKKQRQSLASQIKSEALSYAFGSVSSKEIDELGLSKATTLAITRALDQIEGFNEIIVDGLPGPIKKYKGIHINYQIKADQTIPSVSAASIIAKVKRDEIMSSLSPKYKNYGFDSHVGYGTASHMRAIKKFGICDLHRTSFKPIKNFIYA